MKDSIVREQEKGDVGLGQETKERNSKKENVAAIQCASTHKQGENREREKG